MSKLQQLKKELQEAKHMMYVKLPTAQFLGSQYHYWVKKNEKIKQEIENLNKPLIC